MKQFQNWNIPLNTVTVREITELMSVKFIARSKLLELTKFISLSEPSLQKIDTDQVPQVMRAPLATASDVRQVLRASFATAKDACSVATYAENDPRVHKSFHTLFRAEESYVELANEGQFLQKGISSLLDDTPLLRRISQLHQFLRYKCSSTI